MTSQAYCYLTKFPGEVRRKIYEALFNLHCCSDLVSPPQSPDPLVEKLAATKTNKCTEVGHYLPCRGWDHVHAEIRATCKFICDDVSPLFFTHYALSLSIYDIPVLDGEFWIPPRRMAQYRHLVINIPAYSSSEIEGDVDRRTLAVEPWLNFYRDQGVLRYESLKFQQDSFAFRYLHLMAEGYDDAQAADKRYKSPELQSMSTVAYNILRQNVFRSGYAWHSGKEIRHDRTDDSDEHQYIDRYIVYMSAYRLYNPCPIILPTEEVQKETKKRQEENRRLLALEPPQLWKYLDEEDDELYYLTEGRPAPSQCRLVHHYPRDHLPHYGNRPNAPRPSTVLTARHAEPPRPSTSTTINISY